MYLEYVGPNQKLLGFVQEALLVSDVSPEKALTKRAVKLRNILTAYKDSVSKVMLEYLHRAIALTMNPITESNLPVRPDPNSFNLSDREQLAEFIRLFNEAYEQLLEHAKGRAYNEMAGKDTRRFEDPQDRYLVLSDLLREMVAYLSIEKIKQVHYGMSRVYNLMRDPNYWPDKMMAELNPQDKDLALKLVKDTCNASDDQPFFRFHSELPTMKTGKAVYEDNTHMPGKTIIPPAAPTEDTEPLEDPEDIEAEAQTDQEDADTGSDPAITEDSEKEDAAEVAA